MTVTSLVNALVPMAGLEGPPTMMMGNVTLVGDGTGGTNHIGFQLEGGFVWMPMTVTVRSAGAQADTFAWRLDFIDVQLPNARIGDAVNKVALTGITQEQTFVIPRFLFKASSTGTTPRLSGQTRNTNAVNTVITVLALRWPKNAFPNTAIGYLVAPP